MTQFRKKPVVITAITFDQLVAHGLTQTPAVANGMPWAFTYAGHHVTHENDNCYLIPTLEGIMKMGRDDMLITGVKGEIYPCKRDIFAATYDAEPEPSSSGLPPHQQRVLDEKAELDGRLSKLDAFILDNPLYRQLPTSEQDRMARQSEAMAAYSGVLAERIEAFGAKAALVTHPMFTNAPLADVTMAADATTEQEIQAKANNGPRVTP